MSTSLKNAFFRFIIKALVNQVYCAPIPLACRSHVTLFLLRSRLHQCGLITYKPVARYNERLGSMTRGYPEAQRKLLEVDGVSSMHSPLVPELRDREKQCPKSSMCPEHNLTHRTNTPKDTSFLQRNTAHSDQFLLLSKHCISGIF